MSIKDKDITSYQLLLIKQDRVLVNYLLLWLVKLEGIFYFSIKKGAVGRWETKHFIGMALQACH